MQRERGISSCEGGSGGGEHVRVFCLGFFIPLHNSHCNEVCFRDEAVWMHAKVPRHRGTLPLECSLGEADPCYPQQCEYLFSA